MIQGLDHVQLAMPHGEETQARAFYAELLELTEIPKPQKLLHRGGVWFKLADNRELHLYRIQKDSYQNQKLQRLSF